MPLHRPCQPKTTVLYEKVYVCVYVFIYTANFIWVVVKIMVPFWVP